MIELIVDSEENYFDLICDLNKYGMIDHNRHIDSDKDRMSVMNKFNILPIDIIEDYLYITDFISEEKIYIKDNKEWIEETLRPDKPLNKSKMRFIPEHEGLIPSKKDYPILITWDWRDDLDRGGKIKTRYFDWRSINKIKNSHIRKNRSIIKAIKQLWNRRYKRKEEEFIIYCKERQDRINAT